VQIVALALGFMALLLLTVIRGDLLDAWRRAVPPDAPNRFVVNIQPEQVEPVRAALLAQGVSTELAPMVRGRLTRINGVEVSAASYTDDRAQRLIEREFNLSMRPTCPRATASSGGRWFLPPNSPGQADDGPRLGRRGAGEDAGPGWSATASSSSSPANGSACAWSACARSTGTPCASISSS
jgi:putative ABC transport system permease protein